MTLPPEILDEILKYAPVSVKGRRTVIACAPVATWRTMPSQRWLFCQVTIAGDNYHRWMNGVVLSQSKAHLLEFLRSLWHCSGPRIEGRHQMRDLPRDAGEYLSSLRYLHSLTLHCTQIERIGEEGFHTCFSAFHETLRSLSLDASAAAFSSFVTLVGYFPNITTFQLACFELEPDHGPVPSLPWPLRGKLDVRHVREDSLDFFNRFTELNLKYEELVIDSSNLHNTAEAKFIERALRMSTRTIKIFRPTPGPECDSPSPMHPTKTTASLYIQPSHVQAETAPTIKAFRQLRELELTIGMPRRSQIATLSSITSTELRKVISD